MTNKWQLWLFGDATPSATRGLALLARLVFAITLFMLFWKSGLTKFDGFLRLSDGAYFQIFPKAFEAAGYDASALPFWRQLIAWIGSVSELVLPVLLVLGLFTRLSALGMIGFVIVMSLTDVFGHGVVWSEISDQRVFWVFLFASLSVLGGGWLSLDQLIRGRFSHAHGAMRAAHVS